MQLPSRFAPLGATSFGLLLVALAAPASAQFKVICSETFEYPEGTTLGDETGGYGWSNGWWAGAAGDRVRVTNPGFDKVGLRGTTDTSENDGMYRKPDPTPWPQSTNDNPAGAEFGVDGTIIWVSFEMQRKNGGDDEWGGVSLFDQFGSPGEKLFIGSPFQTGQFGIEQPDQITCPATAGLAPPGSPGPEQRTKLVTRIEFGPTGETVWFWINPPVDHPDPATADLANITLCDFVFDEVRIASGPGASAGTIPGMHFDNLVIECENCPDGPANPPTPGPEASLYSTDTETSLFNGGTQTLTMDAGPNFAGNAYLLLGSTSGSLPGIAVDGLTLPLNFDSYLWFTAGNPNQAPLSGSFGILDQNGQATATFTVPPLSNPGFANFLIHHAFVVVDFSNGQIKFASNAWGVELVP